MLPAWRSPTNLFPAICKMAQTPPTKTPSCHPYSIFFRRPKRITSLTRIKHTSRAHARFSSALSSGVLEGAGDGDGRDSDEVGDDVAFGFTSLRALGSPKSARRRETTTSDTRTREG